MSVDNDSPVGGPDEQRFLKYLGRHIVALCGRYVYLDESGKPVGEPMFYSYTGTVFEVLGSWCIVTAGHVLRGIEAASNNKKVRIESQVLADYCGVGATNHDPIPFKPLEQGWMYIDDEDLGLDFGMIFVSPLYRDNLKSNGILPLTSRQWHFPQDTKFESHGIVGFPDEYSGPATSSMDVSLVGRVKPTFVPIRRLENDTTKTFTRFKAQIIDMGNQKSIKGMSGGPIFGFYLEGGETKYLLEALQVEWNEISKVYGCPILTMMTILQARLNEYQDSQKSSNA